MELFWKSFLVIFVVAILLPFIIGTRLRKYDGYDIKPGILHWFGLCTFFAIIFVFLDTSGVGFYGSMEQAISFAMVLALAGMVFGVFVFLGYHTKFSGFRIIIH